MLKRFQIFKLNPVALLYFKKSMDNCKILEDFESSKHFQIAKGLNTNKNSFGKKRKKTLPNRPGQNRPRQQPPNKPIRPTRAHPWKP
jgi:hypothetical protein